MKVQKDTKTLKKTIQKALLFRIFPSAAQQSKSNYQYFPT